MMTRMLHFMLAGMMVAAFCGCPSDGTDDASGSAGGVTSSNSGDASTVAFAVAACTDDDPEVAATKAAEEAIAKLVDLARAPFLHIRQRVTDSGTASASHEA